MAKIGGSRTYHLKRRYGITAADADVILAEQQGLCAICCSAPAAHVDHDHVTGSGGRSLAGWRSALDMAAGGRAVPVPRR